MSDLGNIIEEGVEAVEEVMTDLLHGNAPTIPPAEQTPVQPVDIPPVAVDTTPAPEVIPDVPPLPVTIDTSPIVIPGAAPVVDDDPSPLITAEQLQRCIPKAPADKVALYAGPIAAALKEFDINTPLRIAGFLSQIAVESEDLRCVVENLNYTAKGLLTTFHTKFDESTAAEYAHQPERIANHVYANREGNGDEASGDGWTWRGQGLIQVTFKNGAIAIGKKLGVDILSNPTYFQQPIGAARSAACFWHENGLNPLADARDVTGMTHRINGGLNGLEQRQDAYVDACKALGI